MSGPHDFVTAILVVEISAARLEKIAGSEDLEFRNLLRQIAHNLRLAAWLVRTIAREQIQSNQRAIRAVVVV